MTLVLGVDGGNSKAIALVARDDGSIVAAARRLGAADIYAAGDEQAAIELVRELVYEVIAKAGAVPADIGQAVFSMAGADWPEDFALLEGAFAREGFARPPVVVNDAIGALAGAVPDGPAVVVSLGTGAATGARGADGRTWHSSFWQAPQDASELARRALAAVVRSELGIAPRTALTDRLLEATGDADVGAALHRFTSRDRPVIDMSAPVVRTLLDAAKLGDPAAVEVVAGHGAGIGQVAAAAARRVEIDAEPYGLSFCGGLTRGGAEPLIEAAVGAVRAAGQRPTLVAPRWEPAVGALVIGLRMGVGGRDWEGVAARLDETAPPDVIYDVLAG